MGPPSGQGAAADWRGEHGSLLRGRGIACTCPATLIGEFGSLPMVAGGPGGCWRCRSAAAAAAMRLSATPDGVRAELRKLVPGVYGAWSSGTDRG